MVALDKLTGEKRWSTCAPDDRGAGHSSIVISNVGGTRVYVQSTGSGAMGVRARRRQAAVDVRHRQNHRRHSHAHRPRRPGVLCRRLRPRRSLAEASSRRRRRREDRSRLSTQDRAEQQARRRRARGRLPLRRFGRPRHRLVCRADDGQSEVEVARPGDATRHRSSPPTTISTFTTPTAR